MTSASLARKSLFSRHLHGTYAAFGISVLMSLFGLSSVHAETSPDKAVLTSIAPLNSLVSHLLEGVAKPSFLIPITTSPHDYVLAPNDVQRLAEAKLFIFIDHNLESLAAKIEKANMTTRTLEIRELSGLTLHTIKAALIDRDAQHHDGHDEHEHHNEHLDEHHDEHEHHNENHDKNHDHHHAIGSIDPHLWLDPINMMNALPSISTALIEVFPAHKSTILGNQDRLTQRLFNLHQTLQESTKALSGKNFVTTHSALQYFASRYDLNYLGALTNDALGQLRMSNFIALKKVVDEAQVDCLLADHVGDQRYLPTFQDTLGVNVTYVDPFFTDGDPQSPDFYFTSLLSIFEDIQSCFDTP